MNSNENVVASEEEIARGDGCTHSETRETPKGVTEPAETPFGDQSPNLCVNMDGKLYPLAADNRNDPLLLDRIAGVLPTATSVQFEMTGLFALAPTFSGRVIAGLVSLLMTRPELLWDLFRELLDLDPRGDQWHEFTWECALKEVATALTGRESDAQYFAREIATRAKALGIKKCTMSKIVNDIAARARRIYGDQFRQPRGHHLNPPNADAGPAGNYYDPLAYLRGEFLDQLWHDGAGNGYVTVGSRNLRIGSTEWSNWLRATWHEAHAESLKEDQYKSCVATVSAIACTARKCELSKRIGRHGDKIYVDLANDEYEVVEISADGWKIIAEDCPLKFVRSHFSGTLPRPERGGSIESLLPYANLSDQDFRCYVASLLDALKGHGEYLVTAILGEKGSAKSTITRVGVRLIDPHRLRGPNDLSDLTGLPKGEDDLAVLGCNHHLAAFDNVGRIANEMSDALCRLSTGGSITKRKLYTDGDVVRLAYCGPVLMNGITDIITRGDLADRSVILRARPIAKRVSSEEFWSRFSAEQPKILGALFDAVSAGLASEATGAIPSDISLPRMAASATWIYRCFQHFGWSYADWFGAVTQSQTDVDLATLHGSELGKAIVSLWQTLNHQQVHKDTPLNWHRRLLAVCPMEARKYFPSVNRLKGALTQLAPSLRLIGIDVAFPTGDRKEKLNGSKQRVISIQSYRERNPHVAADNSEYCN